jgi:hypothetical protein
MKRSPLKRKTPLKNGTPMKRSCVRIAPRSDRRAGQEKLYAKAKREYQAEHPQCEFVGCTRSLLKGDLIDLHHKASRTGSLLYNEDYFASLCRQHHDWCHAHPSQARAAGWIVDLTSEQIRAMKDN